MFVATSGCTWQQLPSASFGPRGRQLTVVSPSGRRPGRGPSSTAWSLTNSAPAASWTGPAAIDSVNMRALKGGSGRSESSRAARRVIAIPQARSRVGSASCRTRLAARLGPVGRDAHRHPRVTVVPRAALPWSAGAPTQAQHARAQLLGYGPTCHDCAMFHSGLQVRRVSHAPFASELPLLVLHFAHAWSTCGLRRRTSAAGNRVKVARLRPSLDGQGRIDDPRLQSARRRLLVSRLPTARDSLGEDGLPHSFVARLLSSATAHATAAAQPRC